MSYILTIERSTEIVQGDENVGVIVSSTNWIPHILLDLNVIKSTSELKRNRPDLWRTFINGEVIQIGRRKRTFRLYTTAT